MKLQIIVCSLFISASSFAFGIGSYKPSLFDELLIRAQIKNNLHNKNKKENKIDTYTYCYDVYEQSRSIWERNIEREGKQLQVQGFIDKKFSHDQILHMKKKHRFLNSTVRGQDQLVNKSSFGSSPVFPHSRPTCENFFSEEVSIVEIQGKSCRQVKFSTQENPDLLYYQVFCENDANIYINFAPTNEALPLDIKNFDEDCVSCH